MEANKALRMEKDLILGLKGNENKQEAERGRMKFTR
jgi:hypothetical protein